jgi:hypothetical protein
VTSARGWLEGAATHLRADIAVARNEVGVAIRSTGAGAMLCAAGATIGLLGAVSLISGLIFIIGDQWLPRDWYALGALIVALVAGAIASLFARRGVAVLTQRR